VGLSAYLFAAISCGIAWARVHENPRTGRLAAILLVLEAGLFLDMLFNGRWLLHDLLQGEAMAEKLYTLRTGPQIAMLGLLGAAAVGGVALAFRSLRGRTGAAVAICGMIFSLSCWCAEVISLHAIDAVLYRSVGGVMFVSLIWVLCSLTTSLGILWDTRVSRVNTSSIADRTKTQPLSQRFF